MNPISAEIVDQSEGGLGILCNSMRLPKGIKVDVLVDALNVIKKRAEVIWSECEDGGYRFGLQWL